MEAAVTQSISSSSLLKPPRSCSTASISLSPSISQCRPDFICAQNLRVNNFMFIRIRQHCSQRNAVGVVHASQGGIALDGVAQGWLLEPVGNGDWKHIGYKVAMPGAYEIFSSEMTVGRVPEKADLVIPVATVSGLHARIQNREGSLFITDLDSTNGTFINEKRVLPGATALVPPGSLLTFGANSYNVGDTNLAIFRVSRLKKAQQTQEEAEEEAEYTERMETAPQPQTTS